MGFDGMNCSIGALQFLIFQFKCLLSLSRYEHASTMWELSLYTLPHTRWLPRAFRTFSNMAKITHQYSTLYNCFPNHTVMIIITKTWYCIIVEIIMIPYKINACQMTVKWYILVGFCLMFFFLLFLPHRTDFSLYRTCHSIVCILTQQFIIVIKRYLGNYYNAKSSPVKFLFNISFQYKISTFLILSEL